MIVYRLLDDGAFVAGDTDTERTSYAYPTSTHAMQAKRDPAKVAAEMMKLENQTKRIPAQSWAMEFDAANWKSLNKQAGSRFA